MSGMGFRMCFLSQWLVTSEGCATACFLDAGHSEGLKLSHESERLQVTWKRIPDASSNSMGSMEMSKV